MDRDPTRARRSRTPASAVLLAALAALPVSLTALAALPSSLAAQTYPPAGDPGAFPWPRAQAKPAPGSRWHVFAAASAGSAAGFWLGYLAPGVVSPDDCQETCAGMWVTIPAGSVLGAAAGGSLAGGAPRGALLGSALGFAAGLLAGNAAGGDEVVSMTVFSLTHGAITALLSTRR